MLQFVSDEHGRADVTAAQLAKIKPAFKERGSVTADNASGLDDGAAAVVLAHGQVRKNYRLPPIARLMSRGYAGVGPALTDQGPAPVSVTLTKLARA